MVKLKEASEWTNAWKAQKIRKRGEEWKIDPAGIKESRSSTAIGKGWGYFHTNVETVLYSRGATFATRFGTISRKRRQQNT